MRHYTHPRVDDVSFTVESALPEELLLEPEPGHESLSGSQGGSASLPIRVFRENGAEEPIELHVSGLPKGVTVSGGATIPSGQDFTTLKVAIAEDAATGEVPITITATSNGLAAEPAPIHTALSVSSPLSVYLNSDSHLTTAITPCGQSGAAVTVGFGPGVTGDANLTLSASGDTSGLSYSLAETTVAARSGEPGGPVALELSEPESSGSGMAEITVTARDGGFRSSTATLVVDRETGTITSVSAAPGANPFHLPEAPQLLHSGTQVTINGTGLCPGSTVEFGNERALVEPSSTGPDGSSLVASIPTYATTGTVIVQTPSGALRSPQQLQIDNFRDVWGWPWQNLNSPKYLTFGLIEELFGPEETTFFGTSWPNVNARVFKAYASELLLKGSCFGMSALIQYISEYSDSPVGLNYEEFLPDIPRTGLEPFDFEAHTGASPPLEEIVSLFHFDQDSAQVIEYEVEEHESSHPPLYAIEQLRQALQQSAEYRDLNFDFITLENQGPHGGGHAVVPYNLEPDGSGGYYIDVYNPDTPYYPESANNRAPYKGEEQRHALEESRIHVNSQGEWTFQDGFKTLWHGESHSLVVVPWNKLPVPDAVQIPEPAEHPERPQIPGISTLLNVLGKWIGVSSSGPTATITQVTDASGHTLVAADGAANLNAATRIPHAQLHFPATEGDTIAQPSAWLPTTGSYKVTETGKATGTYTQTVLSSHIDAVVQSQARPGVSDYVGVTPATDTVSFTAGSTKPLDVEMVSSAGHRVTHSVELTTTSVRGATQSLGFSGSTLLYSHKGPGTTIDLQLSTASPDEAPVALSTGPISVRAGQSVRISPTNWASLGAVRVTVQGDGSSRTLLVRNTKSPSPVKALSLSVRKLPGLLEALTIKGRVGALPGGAQLKFLWTVEQRSRVIAHHVVSLSGRQLLPGTRSESFTFDAPSAGRYVFVGRADLLVAHGIIERGSTTSRSRKVQIG